MITSEQLLLSLRELTDEFKLDAMLDLLYDTVDTWLLEGKYDLVDRFLQRCRQPGLHDDLLLGALTSTLPAKAHLPTRPSLFEIAKEQLGEEVLYGLE